jgi:hypothetical protein
MPEVGFGCSGRVVVEDAKDRMKSIAGGGGPLHGVIDFSGCRLLRRLCGILVHFSFRLEENGTIFGAVVSFTTMIHAIWRFECVRVSVVISAPIWHVAYLAALHETLVRGPWISFLRSCSKVLLPIF